MLLVYLSIALCIFVSPSLAYLDDVVDYRNYSLISATSYTDEHLTKLRDLYLHDADYKLDFWDVPRSVAGEVVIGVPNRALKVLEEELSSHGIPFIQLKRNLQELIEQEQRDNPSQKLIQGRATATFSFDQYHRIEEIQTYLKELGREKPELVKTQLFGHTIENREILGVSIGGGDGKKPVVLIDAGIHAREWIAPATALYIMNQLVTKYGVDPQITDLVNKYEWIIIPVINPDGYAYTWKTNRAWRKNRSRPAPYTGCYGADPNRNFALGFFGASTSDNPCSDLFPGPNAFSESEARALQKVTLANAGRIRIALTLHAFGQMWMSPWGYINQRPKDYDTMYSAAKTALSALTAVHGTKFAVGPIFEVIYPTGGGSSDWQYSVTGTPYVYAIELRPTQRSSYGFELPRSEILPTAEETWAGISTLAKTVA